ncbi:hypothetical protein ACWD5B_28935 [Streptomyces tanashiensis]
MTQRIRLDEMTSDQLDALYDEQDALLAEIERMKILVAASSEDGQAIRMAGRFAEKAIENGERAERAEATLNAVRAELDRMAALSTVTYDDGRADTFPVGARWALRMIRENALDQHG